MKKTFITLFILIATLSTIFTGCITFVNPEEDTTLPTIDETDDTGFVPSPELNGDSSYDCYITVEWRNKR